MSLGPPSPTPHNPRDICLLILDLITDTSSSLLLQYLYIYMIVILSVLVTLIRPTDTWLNVGAGI